jgi:hypothetical protein
VGGWYVGCWRSGLNVEKAAIEDLEVCILDARAIVDNMIVFCVGNKERASELTCTRQNHRGGPRSAKQCGDLRVIARVDQVFSKRKGLACDELSSLIFCSTSFCEHFVLITHTACLCYIKPPSSASSNFLTTHISQW